MPRLLGIGVLLTLAGCSDGEPGPLVVYTSVDPAAAQFVLDAFTDETGIAVDARFDTEATKSVGLAERLRAEAARPRADVWWGNEVFYTVGLAEDGLLRETPVPSDTPPLFVGAGDLWVGNGLRARVLAVPPRLEGADLDLLDLPAAGEPLVMARPTAGTTGGHVAALYHLLGQDAADAYFADLHAAGTTLVGGNSVSAEFVANGTYAVGFTDNDDVANVQAAGGDLAQVLPDQDDGEPGTLVIPTTVALVAGRDDPRADLLAAYLAGPEAEQVMLDNGFAAFSVRDEAGVRVMQVDYAEVARVLRPAIERATGILEGADIDDLPAIE